MVENRSVTNTGFIVSFCTLLLSVLLCSLNAYAFPYRGMDINVQTSVTETYDDNLTFTREDRKEDFVTALGLDVGVRYEGRRRSLSLNASANERFHSKYDEIKSSSERVSLSFLNEFSAYDRIKLTDAFSHSRTPAGFEEEFGRVRGRRETFRNRAAVNYQRNLGDHFTVNSNYAYTVTRFPKEDLRDSSRNDLGFNVNYRRNTATTLFLSYHFSRNSFDISNHTAAVGIKQYLKKKLHINASVGVSYLPSFGVTKNYIQSSLTDEIDRKTRVKLSFIKRERSVSDRKDVFSNWRASANFIRQLSDKLGFKLLGFYGEGKFLETGVINTLTGADVTFSYAFLEDFTGQLRYAFSDYDSTREDYGYRRNTVSISLKKTF